ncbi:hypothetical protein [Gordonia sp. HS-NH1]|uniref:hypothetical protein n=1 Tax=Gordonia sp. HS-NH1 TaxID=1435068 RepID=UPI0006E163C5|nr:hypothetical protein [Gordonia sp. HS-NH1]
MATTLPTVASDSGAAESEHDDPISEEATAPTEPVVDSEQVAGQTPDTDSPDAGSTDTGDAPDDDSGGADSGADDSVAESSAEAFRVRRTIYFAASVIVAAAAIIAAVTLGRTYTTNDAALARDNDITTVARQVVANLVTLRHGSADADVQRIRDGATGEFLNQIGDTTGGFAAVLKQGQVDSTGEANEVAILSSNNKAATVIAAVTSQVKNSEAPEGQPRVYRMKLQLTHVDDRWLVSNVEFVS